MKKSMTQVIFVNAISSATSVLAPGKIKSRSTVSDKVGQDSADDKDRENPEIARNAMWSCSVIVIRRRVYQPF